MNDLSLKISDGELVVMLGPSGCGKTTTLRLIAGLDRPDAGTIRIGDHVVNDLRPRDRDVAMVFQHYALYSHLTVFGNLAFGLRMRGVARDEIRLAVRAAAEKLGLVHLLERKPDCLSGGEQQRVAVGRAIVRNPRVFLMDEPLAHLDAVLRSQTRAEIKSLQRELGATMIYVTHDHQEAMALGDRLAVMRQGAVQQVGAPQEIFDRPANRFVASLVGDPAMNFFRGTLERLGGSLGFVGGLGRLELTRLANYSAFAADGNREVVLGLRPSDVSVEREAGEFREHGVEATVDLVERLGDRNLVHARLIGGEIIVACVPFDRGCPVGERIRLRPDPTRIHLFEAGGGERRLG